MEQAKEKELSLLNIILAGLAVGTLGVAAWQVATSQFKGGTDDLFIIFTCLLLALVFAINPLVWAYSKGWISNPFGDVPDDAGHAAGHEAAHEAHGGSNRENVVIWGALLALTGIEVLLAYIHIDQTLMLIILMGLSIIKAALIVAYFMHMKFERLSFILTIVPILVVLLCLFATFFPDSGRVKSLRSHPSAAPAQTEEAK
jgi:cytochrome c oxidase subunit 4